MFLAGIPGIGGLGWPELIIIAFVLILLFGAKKLPEMARGTGRALRIFKAETKGLMSDDDDDDDDKPASQAQIAKKDEARPAVADETHPAAQPLPPTHTEK